MTAFVLRLLLQRPAFSIMFLGRDWCFLPQSPESSDGSFTTTFHFHPRRWERSATIQEILEARLRLRDGLRMVGLANSKVKLDGLEKSSCHRYTVYTPKEKRGLSICHCFTWDFMTVYQFGCTSYKTICLSLSLSPSLYILIYI